MVQLKGLGEVTVVTAGTPVRLSATSIIVAGLTVRAEADNAGTILLGGSDVSTLFGAKLNAGDVIDITGPNIRGIEEELDLKDIWIDATDNNCSVTVAYLTRAEAN